MAASRAKAPAAREWLRADERGIWETTAASLLERTAAKAAELCMSPGQVDEEIADRLVLDALEALIEHQKKVVAREKSLVFKRRSPK